MRTRIILRFRIRQHFAVDTEQSLSGRRKQNRFFLKNMVRKRNIGTTSILGSRRTNQSRIFDPGMHEDISGRDNVRSTFRDDVREADKLDTTVDGPTTDERNTASSRIVECTPKSIFHEEIKEFDSCSQMNLAKYVPVKTPDLVSFREPTIQTYTVLDQRSGGVATRISEKDGIS